MKRNILFLAMLMGVMVSSGCTRYADYPAGTVMDINDSSIIEVEELSVDTSLTEEPEITEYIIGQGDVLSVYVPGMVERSASVGYAHLNGFRVNTDGTIFLPHVGRVEVEGLSITQLQDKLVEIFKTYIKDPVLTAEVIDFKSQPLYLLGGFHQPGVKYLDRPTKLLNGLAHAGGLNAQANLRGARLIRDDRVQPVDIYELLHQNDLSWNVQLRAGDTIFVPSNEEQRVFVFSAGGGKVLPMNKGRLNILEALAQSNMENVRYDSSQVRILRSLSQTKGQLMVVDVAKMIDGLAMPIPLMDGDIVYMPQTPIANWNDEISKIIPTFQAIGAVLTPFVQIKFIRDEY